MSWAAEFNLMLDSWAESPVPGADTRRQFVLHLLKAISAMDDRSAILELRHRHIATHVLSTADVPMLADMFNRFRCQIGLVSEAGDFRQFFGGFLSERISQGLHGDFALFLSLAQIKSGWKIPVWLDGNSRVSPDMLSVLEQSKEQVQFKMCPSYFRGDCWFGLGWMDFLRSLKLVSRPSLFSAVQTAAGAQLSSLAWLVAAGHVDDNLLPVRFRHLVCGKFIAAVAAEDYQSEMFKGWLNHLGTEKVGFILATAIAMSRADQAKNLLDAAVKMGIEVPLVEFPKLRLGAQ